MRRFLKWSIGIIFAAAFAAWAQYYPPNGGGGSGGASNTQGTFAALPATCVAKDLYFMTNSPINLARCDTSIANQWNFFLSGVGRVTPPVLGNFTWVNQGIATSDTTHNGIILGVIPVSPPENTFAIHALVKTAPATPYHVISCFSQLQGTGGNFQIGIVFRESGSGKLIVFGTFQATIGQFVAFYASSPTAFGGTTPVNVNSVQPMGPYTCLRIGDDGAANRTYDVSANGGATWYQLGSDSRTSNMTADQVGFFIDGGVQEAHFLHYSETN